MKLILNIADNASDWEKATYFAQEAERKGYFVFMTEDEDDVRIDVTPPAIIE